MGESHVGKRQRRDQAGEGWKCYEGGNSIAERCRPKNGTIQENTKLAVEVQWECPLSGCAARRQVGVRRNATQEEP